MPSSCSRPHPRRNMSTIRELSISREHWSYSALNQFINICSLQFAFQRIYRVTPEFIPVNLSFGSAFHRALEGISLQRLDGKIMAENEAQELFTEFWKRQQAEDRHIRFEEEAGPEVLAEQGRSLVSCYTKNI